MEFSRQNTGEGSHSVLQRVFPTQGSNPGLPHCRWILYQLSHQGSHKSSVCPTNAVFFSFFFFICSGFCHTLQMLFSFRWSSWLSRVDSFIHPSIHPFIYPSNKLFTKHSHCTGSFQMFITYWRVLGTDKTGLTTIEECEDKSAHIANMWRKHVSQSGLCPELGLRQWSMTSGAFDWAEEQTY